MGIDAVEVLVATLGLACSIYDPWVNDPYSSVWVTVARTTGVITLFIVVGVGSVSLVFGGYAEVSRISTMLSLKIDLVFAMRLGGSAGWGAQSISPRVTWKSAYLTHLLLECIRFVFHERSIT